MAESLVSKVNSLYAGGEESFQQTIEMAEYLSQSVNDAIIRHTIKNLLTMVKKYYPRLLTEEEVKRGDPNDDKEYLFPVYLKRRDRDYIVSRLIDLYESEDGYVVMSCGSKDYEEYHYEDYNKTWRCWSAEPTEEQRARTKWDEDNV